VKSAADVLRYIGQGNKVRQVAATGMNDESSRSHSIFTIKIERKVEETDGMTTKTKTLRSKINLVDLAGANLLQFRKISSCVFFYVISVVPCDVLTIVFTGSERAESTGATGARLKEGAAINKRYESSLLYYMFLSVTVCPHSVM